MLSKGPPTETVRCEYFTFKGTPTNNWNLKVMCFQTGPHQVVKCVSTLIFNFIERAS